MQEACVLAEAVIAAGPSPYSDDMQIPGLGKVIKDADLGCYQSEPVPVPVLGGALCSIIIDGYDDDPAPEDFHAAVRTFLALDRSALAAATPSIFAYYHDVMNDVVAAGDHDWYVEIQSPDKVLDHIRFGEEPTISRDSYSDQHVYVSLECECAWEPEHGLQIVFRDGRSVTKVGPYDGHLTNSAAYADDTLDGVVYHMPR
ncbi:DUF6985 domain-containing protein [Actinomadura algeriensis]|uniref:DUF6985 domain-containing protein n=1 Tax=Actinomadura algeriensis TaxID=1679523 RepID=A0ABR9JIJ9_9ACTN|nr:hypothetical protein [Actinomadura algeriensis]MBE1530366.1 hypothetical protein [Actinomadura algeriensis]